MTNIFRSTTAAHDGSFSIDAFKANVAGKGGFTRGNFFGCSIVPPAALSLPSDSSLCKSVTLPQATVEATEIPYFTRPVKIPGRRTFAPITLSFYNTADYSHRLMMEEWLTALNNPDTNRRRPTTLTGEIQLIHFDVGGGMDLGTLVSGFRLLGLAAFFFKGSTHHPLAVYRLHGAFPTSVGPMAFTMETDEIQTFDVEFQYQSMDVEKVS
jgi:hypothetical protein